MTDLRERFARTDDIATPDLWHDIQRRVDEPSKRAPNATLRKVLTIAAAFAIAAAATALLLRAFDQREVPVEPPPAPPTNGEIAVRASTGERTGAIIAIDPVSGEESTLPVVVPPEDLWFQGLDRRADTDQWWSPDGTALAYNWEGDLWVLDVASGESRRIMPACECRELAWSPDGTAIAIARGSFAESSLEVMRPDGTDRTVIKIDAFTLIDGLAWTPDGERILFADESDPNIRQQDLYVIDRDGANLTLLDERRFKSRDVGDPVAWSPDATRVAYFTWCCPVDPPGWTIGIVVADFDGSNRRVVLEEAGECGCDPGVWWPPYLTWSPDGTQLAVVIDGPGEQPQGLYVMNADGTDFRLLREDVMGRPTWGSAPPAPDEPMPSATPADAPAILEGVEVQVPSSLDARRPPQEIARIAMDAIAANEVRVGRALAPPRLVSVTLVPPFVRFENQSSGALSWGVRFEGTIVMCGGVPACFGYTRGEFFIHDPSGEIHGRKVEGPMCFVSSANGERPTGYEDTPAC